MNIRSLVSTQPQVNTRTSWMPERNDLTGIMLRSVPKRYQASPGPVALGLMTCINDDVQLQSAARVEVTTEFGIHVPDLWLLAATQSVLVVAFDAVAVSRPQHDPVWCIMPWLEPTSLRQDYYYHPLYLLKRGVELMLRNDFEQAVDVLVEARYRTVGDAETQLLYQRTLAANISLAVLASRFLTSRF